MTSPKEKEMHEVKSFSIAARDSVAKCGFQSIEGLSSKAEDVKTMTRTGVTLSEDVKACETNGELLRKREGNDWDDDEVNDDIPASQITLSQGMSQTDETIRRLDKEGELNEVIGSQSLLSQELICSSQRTEMDTDEKDFSNFQLSQQTETSIAMAQRLGLLSQEEEIKDPHHLTSNEETRASKTDYSQKHGTSIATPPTPLSSEPATSIADTPVRESECFGSLLDAVERITKEEELNAKMLAWQHAHQEPKENDDEKLLSNNPQEAATSGLDVKKKPGLKRKLPTSSNPPISPKKSRKSPATRKKEQEQQKSQEIAKRAACLAEQTITDPELAKKLLLSMALVRENPRTVPSVLPPRGAVVPEGFFWAHYPPLEAVLKKHMAEYYELSTTKCQSAQQQAFNNDLVILVREVANERGWRFHENFSDKGLRDRIRCYYKTHIQNAKKRLRTMVRNPTKRANARHLCAHLDLIEQHGSTSPVKTDDSDDDNEIESQPRPSKMKTEKWKQKNSSIDLIARPTSPNQTSRPRSTRSTRATVKVEM